MSHAYNMLLQKVTLLTPRWEDIFPIEMYMGGNLLSNRSARIASHASDIIITYSWSLDPWIPAWAYLRVILLNTAPS